ncbi:N-acetylmuramoyl-L-alanine amidase [Streptomyces sp. NBC_01429]|uniref:N-acetylmuramoyl-L-alanine amidase n=1 Tax=Streptomyces sp. NBC_01429 TaxID=2903862 RepID=UPI002E2BD2D2|nr:N-acetylmuramoyl-L-alanine amidase [Streptomyces sp. NBC_01429]
MGEKSRGTGSRGTRRRASADGPKATRRAVLIGGAATVLGGGVLARDELSWVWRKLSVGHKPRKEGELDYIPAEWAAASSANWQMADRPDDYRIDRVVIHVVQGSYAVALQVFKDPAHGAAAHYVVAKDGHVAQMIRELDVAYHAGDRGYNERSIGIEHEGYVERPESFTDTMYRSSARLTADICHRYGIPVDREHIVGHVEVPGTDHTDPGKGWDWNRYMRYVREAYARQETAPAE